MIRRRLRESGFTRLIIPHLPVNDSQLTYLPNTELPVIVEEMEPDSPGAKAIPFNDSSDTAFYRADKFSIVFCKIVTPMKYGELTAEGKAGIFSAISDLVADFLIISYLLPGRIFLRSCRNEA
jgi:phenylpyruvate tautomerase PptA (4-oxalocrotonate tautomerase family)